MTMRALRKANLANHIQIVRDGAEAVDFIFSPDEGIKNKPKLILLDLKLPKVDGMEVLQKIKSDSRATNIPVVMLTSSNEQCDIIKSYNLGVNSYVVKPMNFEGFAAAIQEVGKYWLILNRSPI
jgi:two-component system, response regulator